MSASARPRSPAGSRGGPLGALRGLGPHTGLFGLLCLATFFEGFDTKLAIFVQPVIARDYGAGLAEVGTAIGITSFGMVLAFFVNLLADVIGRRPVFLAALVAYAAFTLATAAAPNLVVFTALQFFARMAMVVELFLAYLILSEEIPPAIRGRVNGFFAGAATLGAAVPAGLLAPLDDLGVGWRGLFVIGALPLLLLPIYFRRIPETAAFLERGARGARYGAEFTRIARALWRSEDRARLVRVSLLWLAINFWVGGAIYFFFQYVSGQRGWTADDMQRLPLGTIPLGLGLYALSGFAMDRFGRRPAATFFLAACFVATVVCYRATSDRTIYWAYCTMFGLNGVWVIVTTWTLELFPTASRSTALAIANNLVGRLGLVFGPMLGGFLSERSNDLPTTLIALASVTLLVIPIVWTLPETNGIGLGEDASGR
ncbi:MAG: MFS transporter [Myxococcota bacterium]